MILGGCFPPPPPIGGYILSLDSEGYELVFECSEGLIPNERQIALCSNNTWNPDPSDVECYKPLSRGEFESNSDIFNL